MSMEMVSECAVSTSGKSHNSSELRIVLIGGRELHGGSSRKSTSGNIILGKSVFDTNRRTVHSVTGRQEVHGRQVTVVDTPSWCWHYPRENTPRLDQMEIKNSVYLCPPWPHTFLLVIPAGMTFPENFKPSLEEHLQLFHKGVFNHIIVLFTLDAPHSDSSLENKIRKWPALQWILDQCGNRRHVLNVNNRNDSAQVEKLFRKIEAMIAENAGSRYSVDTVDGNALREEKEAIAERASQRIAEVQMKSPKHKALTEASNPPPSHLRIVMLGAQGSAKSSAGNTILKKGAFCVHHRTECCEVNYSTMADWQLMVVDSPGWFCSHTLQDTCEMDKLEIEKSMYMCVPRPHAVLLVVSLASAFNVSHQRAVQEHMSLFADNIWQHTLILFTRGDWLGAKTVEEHIESETGLQWLVEKCGNRYHVLDHISCSEELLKKIEEMWAGNNGPLYEVDLSRVELIEARKKAGYKEAEKIRQITQRRARILRELFRGERQQITDMRIVLVGRKESGKSMAGNRILFEEVFDTASINKESQDPRRPKVCVKHERNVARVNISVVEVPGWSADPMTPDCSKAEVLHSVSMCAPGPHAFLLVIPISKSFTEADRKAVVELLTPLGERVWRHCMVLFTWGDWINERSIEEHIATEGQALKWLIKKCDYRYHVISCSSSDNVFPVIELFQKILDMITRNKGHFFTAEDKLGRKQKPEIWQAKQLVLTEEEWNRREQELIDRMLKAISQEHEETTVPSVQMTASMDGAFIPSMAGDTPSDVGSTSGIRRACAKVDKWLSLKAGAAATSGVGSMSASASQEELESALSSDENHMSCFSPEIYKTKVVTVLRGRFSTDTAETKRRYSF